MGDVLVELRNVTKRFGSLVALHDVSLQVLRGEAHCLLGDNGAGKSTLIKLLSGVHRPSAGDIAYDGQRLWFRSPRDALDRGIATVYQDLALIPLMSITRNFFLGREPTRGLLRRFDLSGGGGVVCDELHKLGLTVRDPDQPAGTLSGGERQCLAIARAVYFGAELLILDEPTAALGVAQTELVLQTVHRLRRRGVAVIFITHNVRHAYAIGNRFTVLRTGRSLGTHEHDQVTRDELENMMAGGRDLVIGRSNAT